jgi:hypothetical protein
VGAAHASGVEHIALAVNEEVLVVGAEVLLARRHIVGGKLGRGEEKRMRG